MTLDSKTKIGIGFAVATVGAGFWWAATTTSRIEQLTQTVKPIPQMQRDLAVIKATVMSQPLSKQ